MSIVIKLLFAVLAILAAAYFVPGIHVSGFVPAFLAALVLGVLSVTVKPIVRLITLPINVVTLGFFSLVLNALFFWLVSFLVKGFYVGGFMPAFFGGMVVSIVSSIGHLLSNNKDDSF